MKKARNRVKGSKASDGHHFHLPANSLYKSQGSVKSDCRIQPNRSQDPGEADHRNVFQHQHFV